MAEDAPFNQREGSREVSLCEIIGLRVRCPVLEKIVTVKREDFAIGPRGAPKIGYRIRCTCGDLHITPMREVSKPTRTRKAIPCATAPSRGREK
jgi:hypothetical protein